MGPPFVFTKKQNINAKSAVGLLYASMIKENHIAKNVEGRHFAYMKKTNEYVKFVAQFVFILRKDMYAKSALYRLK